MTSNYFKSSRGQTYFFDGDVPESVESAYAFVSLVDNAPSVFQPVKTAGPWDKCKIIGHRARNEILHDLNTEHDVEKLDNLHDELVNLQLAYVAVGRTVPLQAVAA